MKRMEGKESGRGRTNPTGLLCLLLLAAIVAVPTASAAASAKTLPAFQHNYSDADMVIHEPAGASTQVVAAMDGAITTVAGSGSGGFSGDGGPATSARLSGPYRIALDGLGNLFIADRNNHRIRKVAINGGVITTAAGNGTLGSAESSSSASDTGIGFPTDVAVDDAGNLFIVDVFNGRILRVAPNGASSTVAGGEPNSDLGDGGPATQAGLNVPTGVAADNRGNLFIADSNGHRIRRVDLSTGIITTVAGNGAAGFSGDNGPATDATLNLPTGIAVDNQGNLLIADTGNSSIRRVGSDGTIITIAGNQEAGFSGDNGPATQARLDRPTGVAADHQGNLFISDSNNHRVRRVGADGIITTVAGNGAMGFSGDGGAATEASLNIPTGVAVDGLGNLFIADRHNHRIRQVFLGTAGSQPAPPPTSTPAPITTPAPAAPEPVPDVGGASGGGGEGSASGGGGFPADSTPGPLPEMPLPVTPAPVTSPETLPTSPPGPMAGHTPNPTITPAPTPTAAPSPTVAADNSPPVALAAGGDVNGGSGGALGAILLFVGLFVAGGILGLTVLGTVYLTQTGRIQWSREFWQRRVDLMLLWLEQAWSRRMMAFKR